MKIYTAMQAKKLKLLKLNAQIAFMMVIFSILSISMKLIIENRIINNDNIYPAIFHIFNSNIYTGSSLLIKVISIILFAPIVEEFLFRYWINNKSSVFKSFSFIAFFISFFEFFIYFTFPSIFKIYTEFIYNKIGNFELQAYLITIITYFLIPFLVSFISITLIKLFKVDSNFNKYINNLINSNYNLLVLFSALFFSMIHIDYNITNIKYAPINLFGEFITRLIFALLLSKFCKYISFKFSIYFHSFNNAIVLFGYTIFWKNSNSFYYTIGLFFFVVFILLSLYQEYKKINRNLHY